MWHGEKAFGGMVWGEGVPSHSEGKKVGGKVRVNKEVLMRGWTSAGRGG
jgi:hypothetical protein